MIKILFFYETISCILFPHQLGKLLLLMVLQIIYYNLDYIEILVTLKLEAALLRMLKLLVPVVKRFGNTL